MWGKGLWPALTHHVGLGTLAAGAGSGLAVLPAVLPNFLIHGESCGPDAEAPRAGG